jgi:hypothetical protein
MGHTESPSLPNLSRPRLSSRLLAYAGLDLLGVLLFVAGIVPLIDGMPLFSFPATTGEALGCVVGGFILFALSALMMVQEVLRQAQRDAVDD